MYDHVSNTWTPPLSLSLPLPFLLGLLVWMLVVGVVRVVFLLVLGVVVRERVRYAALAPLTRARCVSSIAVGWTLSH